MARKANAVWIGTSLGCGPISASAPSSEMRWRSWNAESSGETGSPMFRLNCTGSVRGFWYLSLPRKIVNSLPHSIPIRTGITDT